MTIYSMMISSSLALTHKETLLLNIDTLGTAITNSINKQEKSLSDRAIELGNRHDAQIKTL